MGNHPVRLAVPGAPPGRCVLFLCRSSETPPRSKTVNPSAYLPFTQFVCTLPLHRAVRSIYFPDIVCASRFVRWTYMRIVGVK